MYVYSDKIQSDPNFNGAVGRALHTIIYLNHLRTEELQYNILKTTFMSVPVVIYARKDFFLLEALNEKIELIKAAGLITFWEKQYANSNMTTKIEPRVLKLKELIGCFQILIIGYMFSFMVFVIEILFTFCRF